MRSEGEHPHPITSPWFSYKAKLEGDQRDARVGGRERWDR